MRGNAIQRKNSIMFRTQRRYYRHPLLAKAIVTTKGSEQSKRLTTQVNTISQGGMGVYTNTPLEKFTSVSVELSLDNLENKGKECPLVGLVVSISKPNNLYLMGVCFDELLSSEQLGKIVRCN